MSDSCVQPFGRRAAVVLLSALAGCGGCGRSHGLPDASVLDASVLDASVLDASVLDAPDRTEACEWRLGEPQRIPRGQTLSPGPHYGFTTSAAPADEQAWVVTEDDEGIWLNHLDMNGESLAPPGLVSPRPGGDPNLAMDVVLGAVGGLVIYEGCPAEGECVSNPMSRLGMERVPQLRAFDASGALGSILFLDDLGSFEESLVGSATGESYQVTVGSRMLRRVDGRGEALGPPMPSPFTTPPFAAFPIGSSSALFVLQPRAENARVWLATVDSEGRVLSEIETEAQSPRLDLLLVDMNASRDRIAVANEIQVNIIRADGRLLWTFDSSDAWPLPVYVGDTLFFFVAHRRGDREVELLRVNEDGTQREPVDIGELMLNSPSSALVGYVSTGSGLLLFQRVTTADDPEGHLLAYPLRCFSPIPSLRAP